MLFYISLKRAEMWVPAGLAEYEGGAEALLRTMHTLPIILGTLSLAMRPGARDWDTLLLPRR